MNMTTVALVIVAGHVVRSAIASHTNVLLFHQKNPTRLQN